MPKLSHWTFPLSYEEKSGDFIWASGKGGVTLGSVAGSIKQTGYREIQVHKNSYLAHRLVWFFHNGYFPENDIDHINRNKLDNRIENLRVVSRQCNMRNKGNQINSSSGVRGVYYYRKYNKWAAHIMVNNETIYLGRHLYFDDAVKARYDKEVELNWFDCSTTSPAYLYLNDKGLLK